MFDSSNRQADSIESAKCESINSSSTARPYHHSVTTLPALSADIKAEIITGDAIANWAKFALFLMDEGYIADIETELTPFKLVQQGINNFLEKEIGSISVCGLSLNVTPNISDAYETICTETSEKRIDESNTDLYMTIAPTMCPWYSIGKKLTEIETAVPGLGQTVYYWLATEGTRVFNIMTPWAAGHDLAPHTWWYGCEDQQDFEEEWEAYHDGDDEAGSVSSCDYSPNAWKAAFPEYVTDIKQPLDIEKLKEISTSHLDDTIKQIAKITISLVEHDKFKSIDVYGTEFESVHSALYLLWEDHDHLNRLMDDFFEMANQSSDMYTEDLALVLCPVDDPKAMKEMLSNLGKIFKQLKNIEQLVNLIGVRL